MNVRSLQIPERMERLPMTNYQRVMAIVICMAWFFDDVDLGTWNYLVTPIKKAFSLDTVHAGYLGSVSFVGMLFGALLAGFLSDKIGRRQLLQWSMLLWGLGGLLCALSWNYSSLAVFRFVLGFGLGAELPVATTMLSEILPKAVRGRYVAIMEGLLPLGYATAGIIAFFALSATTSGSFDNWRFVFVLEAVPAFWLFLVRRSLPESPRWLATKGRFAEAKQAIETFESAVQRRTQRPLPAISTNIALVEEDSSKGFMASLKELWSPTYRKRTFMLWLMWILLLFGYYGLSSWYSAILKANGMAESSSILFVVEMTALGGIPAVIIGPYIIEIIGRKPMIVIATLCTGGSAYLYGHATHGTLMLWGICLQFFQYVMWSGVYAYTPELYPTRLRGTGCGWSNSIGRIGAVFGPSVVGIVLQSLGSNSVFTMGAIAFAVAALATLTMGIETKGRVLEEINQDSQAVSLQEELSM